MNHTIIQPEFSSQLFQIVESNAILDHNVIQFEYLDDEQDGIFPRLCDWTRMLNRIDNNGITEYLKWIAGKDPLMINNGYVTIKRNSIIDDEAEIIFKTPIQVAFAKINEEPITGSVNRIKGKFSHEFYFKKKSTHNRANIIEIYFHCEEYYNDKT